MLKYKAKMRICYYAFLSDESILTRPYKNRKYQQYLNLVNNHLQVYTAPGFKMIEHQYLLNFNINLLCKAEKPSSGPFVRPWIFAVDAQIDIKLA